MKILIVDDEKAGLRTLARILEGLGGHELFQAMDLVEAIRVLDAELIDVAFVDLQLSPDIRNRDGFKLIQEIQAKHKAVPIVVSGHSQQVELREAMRAGVRHYVFKSELDEELVAGLLDDIGRRLNLEREVLELRARSLPEAPAPGLIGQSPVMARLRARIERVALSPNTDAVLVMGPTGSGKELVAGDIHAKGAHARDPFYALNCSALPEHLVEAELFGHVKGAFTGALDRDGALKIVKKGTLFLDEIAEMPLPLQAKLLRALEVRIFRPLGSDAEIKFEGRIVAATHADLRQRVERGTFREDLWYRLNHIILKVPGLEERREDIPTLLEHFIRLDKRNIRFAPEAMGMMCERDWPGNVRALRSFLAWVALEAPKDGVVSAELLQQIVRDAAPPLPPRPPPTQGGGGGAEAAIRDAARSVLDATDSGADGAPIHKPEAMWNALFTEALYRTKGHHTKAAKILGVHRKAVDRWVDAKEKGD